MLAAALSFAVMIALLLGIGAGAALTLGGSITAVMIEHPRADRVRLTALALAILGLLLFIVSSATAIGALA